MCTKPLGDEADLEAALLDTLGLSIDAVQAELDAYPPWSMAQLRQDQACEEADSVISRDSWTIELGCSAEGVEGKLGGEVANHVLVRLTEEAHYIFDFDTSEPLEVWVELRSCELDGLASIYHANWSGSTAPENHAAQVFDDMPPGVYVLRVRVKDASSLAPNVNVALSVAQWP
ncbi:hypothetical protein [Enhygromyxa salina]|uniref:Uncharacterized protein n=1 Tax=Enhygromyxa salina TaxID=215803 RepID=A0A2S9YY85_9BACT|nr:hypothetical protein [Enhygromyxa salina]PRQ10058.1 hypothetical protein ENSA7_02640 [Enhygromyxa salina]